MIYIYYINHKAGNIFAINTRYEHGVDVHYVYHVSKDAYTHVNTFVDDVSDFVELMFANGYICQPYGEVY